MQSIGTGKVVEGYACNNNNKKNNNDDNNNNFLHVKNRNMYPLI